MQAENFQGQREQKDERPAPEEKKVGKKVGC